MILDRTIENALQNVTSRGISKWKAEEYARALWFEENYDISSLQNYLKYKDILVDIVKNNSVPDKLRPLPEDMTDVEFVDKVSEAVAISWVNSIKNLVEPSLLCSLVKRGPLPHKKIESRLSDEKYLGLLKWVGRTYEHSSLDFWPPIMTRRLMLRGFGAGGFVLLKPGVAKGTGTCYKFTVNFDHELEMLRLIGKNNPVRNVITYMYNPEHKVGYDDFRCVRIDYVNGSSLDALISDNSFCSDEILDFGSQITNGLLELRSSGIFFHRDLRPENVIFDSDNGRYVIADLGIASTDPEALAKDNRRYGSKTGEFANDLVSLGQIMYKVATGEHLFAESESMERTVYADELRDHRDIVLNDFELLDEHLKKIDENVTDERVRTLIKTCILAQPEDYSMVNAMFERYRR